MRQRKFHPFALAVELAISNARSPRSRRVSSCRFAAALWGKLLVASIVLTQIDRYGKFEIGSQLVLCFR